MIHTQVLKGKYPCGLLVKGLKEGVLAGHDWRFFTSDAYILNEVGFEEYDASFD